ncbi:MAG: DUF1552 domain-containing protein [Nannocystaceae bacterium]|nr:DUF1552 domain-containing protein [Nannocystaceae bacterium]
MSTRRKFLKGAGGLAVGLPFLPSLAGRAHADCDSGVRRMIVIHQQQGMIMEEWHPRGVGSSFELSPILSPLEPVRDDLVIISGLDNLGPQITINQSGHHGANKSILTGMPLSINLTADGVLDPVDHSEVEFVAAGGPSVDQVIAQRMGAPTPYASLGFTIGGSTDLAIDGAFYTDRDEWLGMEADPRAAFERLFADLDAPPDPTAADRLRASRGSVLDAVAEQYAAVAARASTADRIRLEAHAARIRELELRLGQPGGAGIGCSQPQYSLPGDYDPSNSDFDDVGGRAQIDNAVMALACDQTRVASLQYTHRQSPRFPWLGHPFPFEYNGWHDIFHIDPSQVSGRDNPVVRPAMLDVMRWYADMFGYLVAQLANTPDGDGTLLDSTLVVWTCEFGDGQGHAAHNIPVVLAGNLCGAIETGRHLEYTGRSTNDLLVSLLNAFGHDDTSFGWADNCAGPLPGLVG